jgi:hypothetical protein
MTSTGTGLAARCCEDCFFHHNELCALRDSSRCLNFRPRDWGRIPPSRVRLESRSRIPTIPPRRIGSRCDGETFARVVVFTPVKL